MTSALISDDHRAKRNTAFLVAAQAILGAQMPILFVIGGLVGAEPVSYTHLTLPTIYSV